jgi:hypothetical protein
MPKVGVDNDPLLERLIFAFDGADYRVVACDTDGNVVAALAAGQSIEVTQDTAADLQATVNVNAGQSIAVTQTTPASLQAAVNVNAGQSIAVTQATASSLRAQVDNTPRLPAGVTDLSGYQLKSIADVNYLELFSNTSGTSLAACSGRTVANGKRLCVAWGMAGANTSTGRFAFLVGYDSTTVAQIYGLSPAALYAPSVVLYCNGDGSKVWKIVAVNLTGGTVATVVSALVWEETVF